jgi:hypothetical protein
MGAGSSIDNLPESLSKAQTKVIAGVHYDEANFVELASLDSGKLQIPKERFLRAVESTELPAKKLNVPFGQRPPPAPPTASMHTVRRGPAVIVQVADCKETTNSLLHHPSVESRPKKVVSEPRAHGINKGAIAGPFPRWSVEESAPAWRVQRMERNKAAWLAARATVMTPKCQGGGSPEKRANRSLQTAREMVDAPPSCHQSKESSYDPLASTHLMRDQTSLLVVKQASVDRERRAESLRLLWPGMGEVLLPNADHAGSADELLEEICTAMGTMVHEGEMVSLQLHVKQTSALKPRSSLPASSAATANTNLYDRISEPAYLPIGDVIHDFSDGALRYDKLKGGKVRVVPWSLPHHHHHHQPDGMAQPFITATWCAADVSILEMRAVPVSTVARFHKDFPGAGSRAKQALLLQRCGHGQSWVEWDDEARACAGAPDAMISYSWDLDWQYMVAFLVRVLGPNARVWIDLLACSQVGTSRYFEGQYGTTITPADCHTLLQSCIPARLHTLL